MTIPILSRITLKTLALTAALLVALGMGHYLTPHILVADSKPTVDFEAVLPKTFATWTVDVNQPISVPSPELESMLKSLYSQNISRTYVNRDGDVIMLATAYTRVQTDRTRVHRPEVCYPSQGFQIISQYDDELKVAGRALPLRRMVTRKQERIEYVSYWVLIGDFAVTSTKDEKIKQIKYGVRQEIPDNLLFRVSSVGSDPKTAFARHEAFITDMMNAIAPKDQPRLLGIKPISGI